MALSPFGALSNAPLRIYSGDLTDNPARLIQYVDQAIEGMSTGLFTYLAHPDLIHYRGDKSTYLFHMRRLCRAARELNVPLELNLLGLHDGRNYPTRVFWEIAAEEGNRTVLGCDAHCPEALNRPETEAAGRRFLAEMGLAPEDPVPLVKLS